MTFLSYKKFQHHFKGKEAFKLQEKQTVIMLSKRDPVRDFITISPDSLNYCTPNLSAMNWLFQLTLASQKCEYLENEGS